MMHHPQGGGLRIFSSAAAVIFLVAVVPCRAQPLPAWQTTDSDSPASDFMQAQRLPRDPLTRASLAKAEQAIAGGEVAQGLETLQAILDQDSDFFLADDPKSTRSLFSEVELQLRDHHDEYERLYGPTARQILDDARATQNLLRLEEVTRRFSMTRAGAEALRELATVERDRGEPALAARLLEQAATHPATADPAPLLKAAAAILLNSGQGGRARTLLERHRNAFPSGADLQKLLPTRVTSAVPAAPDAEIYEWRIPSGDVHHAGQTAPAPALFDDRWQASLVHDEFDFPDLMVAPDVARHLALAHRNLCDAIEKRIRLQQDRIAMPAPRPLIVNGLLITSGPGSIKAFNLESGRLEWNSVEVDETFEYLAKASYSAGESHDPIREDMRELFASVRGWRDLTSSSLSSDGQRVYAISNCQLVGTTSPQRMMQNNQRHALLPQRSNLLTAYELATDGKVLWRVGTSTENVSLQNVIDERDIFFYGAPLPLDGRLYILGEERGQIQLFEIDPATGAIIWSIGLLNPDRDLVLDDVRRLAGLMPAYAEGLLICPTGEGSLTAVDPLKRQVVWTHFYSSNYQPLRNQVLMMRMMRAPSQTASQSREELLSDNRWFDSRILVSGSYVVYSPPDDDGLVCVDIESGTSVWKDRFARVQMLYAASIFEDQLILVGRSEISSIRLKDAQPVWREPIPIPTPSGRGLRMGNQFLQPLQTGEIAVIDLPTGRLLTRFAMPSGEVPGNLVAVGGILVSQSSCGVRGFRSRSWLEQEIALLLKDQPADAKGLGLRGEWELQRGQLPTGLRDLTASVTAEPIRQTQQVLVWSLLEGLRTDFATYRSQAPVIEKSLEGHEQHLQFLRRYAQGLQQSGESSAAFTRYLRILEILPWPEEVHDLDSRWAATDSRWVLARLQEILSTSPDETRLELRLLFDRWISSAEDAELLFRILPACPEEWFSAKTVLKRLEQQNGADESGLQGRESLLRPMLRHKEAEVRIRAAALLMNIALRKDDISTINEMLPLLESQNISIPSDPPETSRELAQSVRELPTYKKLMQSEPVWTRHVRVAENQPTPMRQALYQIPLLGAPSQVLNGWTFFVDPSGSSIEVFDPDGRHRSRIPTGFPGVRYASETDLGRYVSMQDHLVLIVLVDRFLLLDFLKDPHSPELITNRTVSGEEDSFYGARGPLPGQPRPGQRTMLLEMRAGRMGGNVGPLNDSILCYGDGSNLVAISPVTGKVLWQRRDLVPGSEIFGDEQYVVVKPPEENTLQIYRALDGGRLGNSALPAGALNCMQRHNGDWGRFIPLAEHKEDSSTWSLFDPATDRLVWSHTGPAEMRWTTVNGKDIAFYAPDQSLLILDGFTGAETFRAMVPVKDPVEQLTLLQFPDQWIMFTSGRPVDLIRRQALGVRAHELVLSPVDGTVAAIDRRSGKVVWSTEVSNQEIVTQCPVRWPIIVFANAAGRMETLVLNRFSGEIVKRSFNGDDGTGISWLTELQPLRIQLKCAQDRMTLLCDESPLPPPEKTGPAPQQSESRQK